MHIVPCLVLTTACALAWAQQSSRTVVASSLCSGDRLADDSVDLEIYKSIGPKFELELGTLWSRELLLPDSAIQAASKGHGGLNGVQTALQKLLDGLPITAVALGGSVTRGHGVEDPEEGWVSQLYTWIASTFPHKQHRLVNRAIPAVTSGYVSACLPDLVPDGTDLVILEFTYNDNVFGGATPEASNPARRGLERLLRRLRGMERPPGVLYLHYWPPARFKPPTNNNEESVTALLEYYQIASLSMKAALAIQLQKRPELLDVFWKPSPDPKIHPTCLGARLMADLVIGFFRETAAEMAASGLHSPWRGLKPFVYAQNWGYTTTKCILEQELYTVVDRHAGWEWVDEGRTPLQHKRGFISTTPGAFIDLQAPLQALPQLSDQFLVGIGGLISYQHMGTMQLECLKGCSCLPVHHNMYHTQEFSMTGWRYVNVTKVSDRKCIIRATNWEDTATGEHKIKISSLMVSVLGEVDTRATSNSNSVELNLADTAMTNLRSSSVVGQQVTLPRKRRLATPKRRVRKTGLASG